MKFTDGYHQTELFPEASTDGAPLFSQPGDDELTPTDIPHFFRAKYPKATPLAIHTERNWTIVAFSSADTWVLDAPMPDFWDRGLCYAVFKDGKYVAEKYPKYIAEIGHAMVISSRGETE